MSKRKKNRVAIVGPVVTGGSFYSRYYGYVTGSDTVINDLGTTGDVEIYVNSPGGSVFAGFEIVNAVNAVVESGRNVTFYISAMAASIASYITTGSKGAKVVMAENGKLMFHAPWTVGRGTKDEFRDTAVLLEQMEDDIKAAVRSRGTTPEESWFAAGRAKWIASAESKQMGLIDAIGNPPVDLVMYVKTASKTAMDAYDSAEAKANDQKAKAASQSFGRGFDDVAAAAMVEGVIEQMCNEEFGEGCSVTNVSSDSFHLTKKDGDTVLLKFSPDALNIVSVDWENSVAVAKNGEDDMSVKNKNSGVTEPVATELAEPTATEPVAIEPVEPVATEPAVEEPVAAEPVEPTATEPSVEEPVATEPVATEPVATQPVATGDGDDGFIEGVTPQPTAQHTEHVAVEPTASGAQPGADHGLTEDMIAFAKTHYPKARQAFIDTIKESGGNDFSDTELSAMSLDTLSKLAKLADFHDKTPRADNSIVASKGKQEKGEATLKPPKY